MYRPKKGISHMVLVVLALLQKSVVVLLNSIDVDEQTVWISKVKNLFAW